MSVEPLFLHWTAPVEVPISRSEAQALAQALARLFADRALLPSNQERFALQRKELAELVLLWQTQALQAPVPESLELSITVESALALRASAREVVRFSRTSSDENLRQVGIQLYLIWRRYFSLRRRRTQTTPKAVLELYELMSQITEEAYKASWLEATPWICWRALAEGRQKISHRSGWYRALNPERLGRLKELSTEAQGWWVWPATLDSENSGPPVFISQELWQRIFASKSARVA